MPCVGLQVHTSGSSRKALDWENVRSGVLGEELAASKGEGTRTDLSRITLQRMRTNIRCDHRLTRILIEDLT